MEELILQRILWVNQITDSFKIFILHQVQVVPDSILIGQIILSLDSLEDLGHGISIIALSEVVIGYHQSEGVHDFSWNVTLLERLLAEISKSLLLKICHIQILQVHGKSIDSFTVVIRHLYHEWVVFLGDLR